MRKRNLLLPLAWLVLVAAGCGEDKMGAERFCSEMPGEICAKLFDLSCDLPGMSRDEVRYPTREACEQAEGQACEALIQNPALVFDEARAHACIAQIAGASCEASVRSEFHDCRRVFAELIPPVDELDE